MSHSENGCNLNLEKKEAADSAEDEKDNKNLLKKELSTQINFKADSVKDKSKNILTKNEINKNNQHTNQNRQTNRHKDLHTNASSFIKNNYLDSVSDSILGFIKFRNENKKQQSKKTFLQKKILETIYVMTQYPSRSIKEALTILLNLDLKVINIWFQNKRNMMIQNKINSLPYKLNKKKSTIANSTLKMHVLLEIVSNIMGEEVVEDCRKIYKS